MKKLILTISVLITLSNTWLYSQEGQALPPAEFPIGAFVYSDNEESFDYFDASGLNHIVHKFNHFNRIAPYKFMPHHEDSPANFIPYYAAGYYTRWEAETTDASRLTETGLKHPVVNGNFAYGNVIEYDGALCWATTGSQPVDDVIWGPYYRQAQMYKFFYLRDIKPQYTVNYRMALTDVEEFNENTEVCRLIVNWRLHRQMGHQSDYITIPLTEEVILKVSDFQGSGLQDFKINYEYPAGYTNPNMYKLPPEYLNEHNITLVYSDTYSMTGVEFKVDWFGVGKLIIDFIEVYDQEIWGWNFMRGQAITQQSVQNIINYANAHTSWPIEYWYVHDEPLTIDAYTPMRIVDSIVTNYANHKRPLITEIYPSWDGKMNGDWHLKKFIEISNPKKLMIDWYPFWPEIPAQDSYYWLRYMFQDAHQAKPDFYYVSQGFGVTTGPGHTDYCWLRFPSPAEFNGSIMLALAHGAKGIMIWHFVSSWSSGGEVNCNNQIVYYKALLDVIDNNLVPSELYTHVKESLSPRLKGKLGNKLQTLSYTGDYFTFLRQQGDNPPPEQIWRYFRLGDYGSDYFWHAGFLQQKNYSDNGYVFLINQRVDGNRTAKILIENVTGYENLSARNVEGGYSELDTTVAKYSILEIFDDFPAGEGKLYQVAPVVKYGGKIIYDETVSSNTILYDDLIIAEGATLNIQG